jgi:hypothetical protein
LFFVDLMRRRFQKPTNTHTSRSSSMAV